MRSGMTSAIPSETARDRLRPRWQPWLFAVLAGAAVGLLILGVGGRYVMRVIAVRNGQVPLWTIGGTVTVKAMGVLSGAAGGAIRAAAAAWLPGRAPHWVGTGIFALACLFLTLRGLSPLEPVRLTLFLPLTTAYVAAFEILWRRGAGRVRVSA